MNRFSRHFHTYFYTGHGVLFALLSLLVACNYFAFRVELCEEEFEAHHTSTPFTNAFGPPTITWETFDKDNAPEAFTVDVQITIEFSCRVGEHFQEIRQDLVPHQPIRDKSPPPYSLLPA
jgi:hypothetical protein